MNGRSLSIISNFIIDQTITIALVAIIMTLALAPQTGHAQNVAAGAQTSTQTISLQNVTKDSPSKKPVKSEPETQVCERELDCGHYATCVFTEGKGQCVELYSVSQQLRLDRGEQLARRSAERRHKKNKNDAITLALVLPIVAFGAGFLLNAGAGRSSGSGGLECLFILPCLL